MNRVPLDEVTIELNARARREERLSPAAATLTIAGLSVLSWIGVVALARLFIG
ncbi:hypothetical protein [Falsiroseomonas bella]|uniref:hypothetical protein n=1 Tax=Falsiroseomonas bella TaxID=2184016 RepID=UPI0013050400|nr:hypothetical protein [Falsiroseomonas bella]